MSNKDWFKSWFNTPYYHKLYKYRDDRDAQLFMDAIIDFLQLKKGDHVLDLACGRGRHALYLQKKGFEVCGLDLSESNITYAKKHHSSVNFAVKDMRENFGIEKYNFIFNLFTSFGYFNTNKEHLLAIKNMASALKPNGVLVLDFMNANKVANGLVKDEFVHVEDIEFRIKRFVADNKIVKEIYVNDRGKELVYSENVALLTEADFISFFKAAKLKLINTLGDFKLNAFSVENSDRLILMAQRI